jgi:hypothetical protein
MDRADLPEEVRGLDREQLLAWRHHPISKAVFRYCQDHREALIREHRDWWLSNTEPAGNKDLEARLRAQIAQNFIDIDYDDIVGFYVPETRLELEPARYSANLNTELTGY